jgi:hypothetical protein
MSKYLEAIRRFIKLRARALGGAVTALAFGLAVTGCTTGSTVVTEPASVQSACTMITLAVPVAELFRSNLTVAEQAMLTSAEAALTDCSAGNATAAVLDVATAIENFLAAHGTTKAMLLRRATMHAYGFYR